MVEINIARILCPVDFSDVSRHAFDCAVAIARSYHAELTVLHVLPVARAVPALAFGPGGPGSFLPDAPDPARTASALSDFLATASPAGVAIRQEVLEAAETYQEVLVQAGRTKADLIVLGTHGRSGVNRFFLGSVAEKTLRTAPVPVLVVPPRATPAQATAGEPFRNILCALDFSPDSDRALQYAASLARHSGGRLTLMHVVEPMPIGHDPVVGVGFNIEEFHIAVTMSARRRLQDYAATASAASGGLDTVLAEGRSHREILLEAEGRGVDLIVVGVHGRNAVDRVVFGSTTEHLIRRGACPILTVRSPIAA
jgi:nucleotide-binding universal stress UspA family protein